MRLGTVLIVLFCLFFLSPNATGENTKAIWEIAINTVNISGYSESWTYRNDKLNKKGKAEAFLFLPAHSRPDDITIIVWFHGCNGYSDRTFDIRLAQQLKKLASQNHSYALVVPELHWSKNTKTTCSRQGKSFRKPGELIGFIDDSLVRINAELRRQGKEKAVNPEIVFIGHSAGGSVIKAASVSGDLCKIKPAAVVWSDSTYGSWFKSAWRHCLSRGDTKVVVLVRKWTATWKSFRRSISNTSSYPFLKVKTYTGKIYHKTIGDNAIEFSGIFAEGC